MDNKKDNFGGSSTGNNNQVSLFFGSSATMGSYEGNESLPIVKRTEKITTAVYLVGDCIDLDEPLRPLMREQSLLALSSAYALLHSGGVERVAEEGDLVAILLALRSYVALSYSTGLMSDMNGTILIKEISSLIDMIEATRVREERTTLGIRAHGKHRDVELPASFFSHSAEIPHTFNRHVPEVNSVSHNISTSVSPTHNYKGQSLRTDNSKGQYQAPSAPSVPLQQTKDRQHEPLSHKSDLALRIARRNTILRLIKDKREVTIKDISSVVSDISEKTIQRELLALVSEGVLNKTGEKRWSRYALKS